MNRDHILAYALPALVAVAVVLGWERFSVAKSLAVLLVVAGVALLVR